MSELAVPSARIVMDGGHALTKASRERLAHAASSGW